MLVEPEKTPFLTAAAVGAVDQDPSLCLKDFDLFATNVYLTGSDLVHTVSHASPSQYLTLVGFTHALPL